MKWRNL